MAKMRAWFIALPPPALARLSARCGDVAWLHLPPAAVVTTPEPDWVIVRELTRPEEVIYLRDVPVERRTTRRVVVGLVFLGPGDRVPPDWTPADGPLCVAPQRWRQRERYFRRCVLVSNRWILIRPRRPARLVKPEPIVPLNVPRPQG